MSPSLVGLHDREGVAISPPDTWILDTIALSENPTPQNYDPNYHWLCRVNWGYGSTGTIPLPNKDNLFLGRLSVYVSNSKNCSRWIIGNEPNLPREWPDGKEIHPFRYGEFFSECADVIHSLPGHDKDEVLIAASGPWNNQYKYAGNPNGDWIVYFRDCFRAIPAGKIGGFSIHGYTHGYDTSLVTSDKTMDAPFQDKNYNFRAYRDYCNAIPDILAHLPIYLTEANGDGPWQAVGLMPEMAKEINNWNNFRGDRKIKCLIFYRYPRYDQGIQYNIEDKPDVIAEYKHTVALGFISPEIKNKIILPVIENNKPNEAAKVPILVHPVQNPAIRRVTQVFGARPEYYKKFSVDGVPLKGHEGIDFGTPTGSVIVAVDKGRVVEAADQGSIGYGKYIKISHDWGESVYAHLLDFRITLGQEVSAGQFIGVSGWSGNVDPPGPFGAHLHFGMRVNPFNRKDGWGGYSNPALYLGNTISIPVPVIVFSDDNWNRAWPLVLEIEGMGTLSTDINDRGNYTPNGKFVGTKWGISARSYPEEDIPNLTQERALGIYKRDYWIASGADKLDWPLALVHFDSYVQNPSAATRFLRNSKGNPVLYMAERIEWYTSLNTWEHHGAGWIRRCAKILREIAKTLSY